MYVVYDKNEQRVPIKIWLEENKIEPDCLEQAKNLSRLPFVFKHIALMPDTHLGMGMPIGGIVATKDVVIPNAIGVDQGCGMIFYQTNLPVDALRTYKSLSGGSLLQEIVGRISRNIPTGFNKHKGALLCNTVDEISKNAGNKRHIFEEHIENMLFQVGTLGGGNHFIELQEDEKGYLGIMIHSGSRNFGLQVANYFNDLAAELNKRWYSEVPESIKLPFLPVDSQEGKDFLEWTNFSLMFANENRQRMMDTVINCINLSIESFNLSLDFSMRINAHHNYVDLENHFGENVWVHRKGAIRARNGELGIIPGAMGSYSYIVRGRGYPESFHSCSHGAGRLMSRKKAKEMFTTQQMMEDLNTKGIILSTGNKEDVTDESRFAYKDITVVMNDQKDLVDIVKELKTVAVVKGSDSSKKKIRR